MPRDAPTHSCALFCSHRQQRTDDLARSYSEAAAHLANLRELRSLTLVSRIRDRGTQGIKSGNWA